MVGNDFGGNPNDNLLGNESEGILMSRVFIEGSVLPSWTEGSKKVFFKINTKKEKERNANILWNRYLETGDEEYAELALIELEES